MVDMILDIMDRWDVRVEKVSCTTTDASTNMKKAIIEVLGLPWLHCHGYITLHMPLISP